MTLQCPLRHLARFIRVGRRSKRVSPVTWPPRPAPELAPIRRTPWPGLPRLIAGGAGELRGGRGAGRRGGPRRRRILFPRTRAAPQIRWASLRLAGRRSCSLLPPDTPPTPSGPPLFHPRLTVTLPSTPRPSCILAWERSIGYQGWASCWENGVQVHSIPPAYSHSLMMGGA